MSLLCIVHEDVGVGVQAQLRYSANVGGVMTELQGETGGRA